MTMIADKLAEAVAPRKLSTETPADAIKRLFSEKGDGVQTLTALTTMAPKGIDAIKLPALMRQLKDTDIDFRWIRPSQFAANIATTGTPGQGYQRPPRARLHKLKAIARKFDPRLLGLFHAWINKDGLLEVLDGLGRSFVCLHLLRPAFDEPVLVAVHLHIKTEGTAAEWFKLLNPDEVTKVSDKQKFLASLTEGDTDAKRMQSHAEAGGLTIGGSGSNGISVQAAEALEHMGVLTKVGEVKIAGGWGGYKMTGPAYIGLGGYLVATQCAKDDLLYETMTAHPPVKMLADFTERLGVSKHARETASKFARQLEYRRNFRRTNNRATVNWTRVDTLMAAKPFDDRWETL
jgi:hypothetical protein